MALFFSVRGFKGHCDNRNIASQCKHERDGDQLRCVVRDDQVEHT